MASSVRTSVLPMSNTSARYVARPISGALDSLRVPPLSDLLAVLLVVMGAVQVDDAVGRPLGLEPLLGHAGGHPQEIPVAAGDPQQPPGDFRLALGRREAGVPGVPVLVADSRGDRLLAAGQPLQGRAQLAVPPRHVGHDVPDAPLPEPDLGELLFVEAFDRVVKGAVLLGGAAQQVVLVAHSFTTRVP